MPLQFYSGCARSCENERNLNAFQKLDEAIKNFSRDVQAGRLYNDAQTANNLANASANQSDIAKSLQRKGFNAETANDIAAALVAKYNGQTLTKAQERLLESAEKSEVVQDAISNIMTNEQSTMGQRSKNIRDFARDVDAGNIARTYGVELDVAKGLMNGKTTAEKNATESNYEVSAEGKTIDKDGNAVNIVGVEFTENGKLLLKTENGTIDSGDVVYASKDDALIYEAVAKMGASPASAWAMIKAAKENGGVSATEFATAAPLAYLYGKLGYKNGVFSNGKPRLNLTESQSAMVYQMGRDDAAASVKSTAQANTKATTSEKNADKEIIYEGFTYSKRKANKVQRASMEAIELINKVSSLEVHVYQSVKEGGKFYAVVDGKKRIAPNGYYTDGNKIYIDINAGKDGRGVMLFTMAHEIGHYIAEYNAADFKAISDFLFEHYGEDAPIYEELQKKKATLIESYKRDGKPVPGKAQLEKEAQEELVCDMLSRMLADQHAYEKLMEFKQGDLRGFQKLGAAIKKFLDKIAKLIGVYDTQVTDFQMAASVETFGEEAFRQLQDLYIKAFVQADANFQAAQAQKNTTEDGGVKQQARHEGYGGIREVLAKKGLDELSKKYGNKFPLSAGFDQAMKADKTPLTMHTVKAKQVTYSKNLSIYKAARNAFIAAYGVKTSVHIQQMGIDAMLYADMANESISKAVGKPNEQSTLDAIPRIREILSDSVLMGIERIAHTGNKGTVLYGYRLYNLYWYDDGQKKAPNCLVCTVVQSTDSAEGYVFHNIENVTVEQDLPGNKTGMPPSLNSNTYTIAQLYKTVKKIDRGNGGLKYTDTEKDKYLFAYTERNDGVKYSDRDNAAVEAFGTTTNFEQTGFVLGDGSMLKLSLYGLKGVKHQLIEQVYDDVKGSDAVNRFIQEGHVRIKASSPGIEIGTEAAPTVSQLNTLSKFISGSLRSKGVFYLDITGKDGEVIASVIYDDEYSAEDILYDVKAYYSRGRIPTVRRTFFQERPYSYDALISKPDMKVTTVGSNVPKNRADVVHQAKQNAAKVGKFDPKDDSVSVHVKDIDADVFLGRDGLRHSIDRRFNVNAPVVLKAGEILSNSIRINELTPKKEKATESYVLIGAARNDSGELFVVRSVVNRFTRNLTSMDVLYAINAKKEPAALLPLSAGKPALGTDSTISIAKLFDYVNEYFPDILPEDVLKHYGHSKTHPALST